MKTYAVELIGEIGVTAHVVAESPERAKEIAWINDDPRAGESVVYQQGMTCYDDGLAIGEVHEVATASV
jgi:hypothetical protein